MRPQGCHLANPWSRLKEPETRGLHILPKSKTLVVALGWACATARVVYYTLSFPRWSFGAMPLRPVPI